MAARPTTCSWAHRSPLGAFLCFLFVGFNYLKYFKLVRLGNLAELGSLDCLLGSGFGKIVAQVAGLDAGSSSSLKGFEAKSFRRALV